MDKKHDKTTNKTKLIKQLAEYGITVNTINPGWVDTKLGRSSIEESDFSEEELKTFLNTLKNEFIYINIIN